MEIQYEYIYGKHAVLEALRRKPQVIASLHVRSDVLSTIPKALLSSVKKVVTFEGNATPKGITKDAVHQGYIAHIDISRLYIPAKEFLATVESAPDTCLLMLGEIQDPHNVGAVIRNAAAFGTTAVLIPEHRQAGVTGTVLKVSAGMAFSVPIVMVPNVNRMLNDLKQKGFFVYGLDAKGDTVLAQEDFRKASVVVLGNEGDGLRAKTRDACDVLLTIPMHPQCESLNASVSAALVLYEWSKRHPSRLST